MKYRVKDVDGNAYEVEEMIEKDSEKNDAETKTDNNDANALSDDEISALKSLAAVAPKILDLLKVEEEEHTENTDLIDEDTDEDKDDETMDDEVVETSEENKKPAHDSKRSFGAIEKKTVVNDSVEDDDIAKAWAKRYGGIN